MNKSENKTRAKLVQKIADLEDEESTLESLIKECKDKDKREKLKIDLRTTRMILTKSENKLATLDNFLEHIKSLDN